MRAKICPICGKQKKNLKLHLGYCKEADMAEQEARVELTKSEEQEAELALLIQKISGTVEEAREFDDNKREDILRDIIRALEEAVWEYC